MLSRIILAEMGPILRYVGPCSENAQTVAVQDALPESERFLLDHTTPHTATVQTNGITCGVRWPRFLQ